jgi:hypothetical protein
LSLTVTVPVSGNDAPSLGVQVTLIVQVAFGAMFPSVQSLL